MTYVVIGVIMEMGNQETDDASLLRKVFPEEVWLEIVNHLSQFSKERLFYSHSYFRRLLHPASHQFLFPQLYHILAKFEYRAKIAETAKVTSPKSNLRQVCKYWCSYIDSTYDAYGCGLNFNYFPDDSNKAQMFLDHFRDTHAATDRNPFVGREMRLSLYNSTNQGDPTQRFLQAIMEILRIYGQHIWFLEIMGNNGPEPSIRANYSRVKSWLLHTPNLKSFTWNEYGISDLTQHEVAELEELVKTSPVPRLGNIKQLDLKIHESIAEHFMRINSHLEDVSCSASILWDQINLPNLSKLSISSKKLEDIGPIEKARVYGWKLKYIDLYFSDIPHFVPLERFWSIMQIWSDTLELVGFLLPAAQTLSELEATLEGIKGADLHLPKVGTVHIAITQ